MILGFNDISLWKLLSYREGKPKMDAARIILEEVSAMKLLREEDPSVQILKPIIDKDRMYGRGACDTKSSLAGLIYMMEQCVQHRDELSSDIVFCATVDEEYAAKGMLAF